MKRAAAAAAAELATDGMVVGLGSGTTALELIRALGRRRHSGLQITAVASSVASADLARSLGIPLVELTGPLDLAIDGADAVDRRNFDAIKGLGGALTREHIVAASAARFVLIVDERKMYDTMSAAFEQVPVPIAVVPFGWQTTRDRLRNYGSPELRIGDDGEPYTTDDGNYILDLHTPTVVSAADLARKLKVLTGVVDHGLFCGLATDVVIGTADGVEKISTSSC